MNNKIFIWVFAVIAILIWCYAAIKIDYDEPRSKDFPLRGIIASLPISSEISGEKIIKFNVEDKTLLKLTISRIDKDYGLNTFTAIDREDTRTFIFVWGDEVAGSVAQVALVIFYIENDTVKCIIQMPGLPNIKCKIPDDITIKGDW